MYRRVLMGVLAVLLLAAWPAAEAQQESSAPGDTPTVPAAASVAPVAVENQPPAKSPESKAITPVINKLRLQWEVARAAIEHGDLRRANELINDLDANKVELGYSSLDDYSLQLLRLAEERLSIGDRDTASFLTRKALQLSPASGAVLIRSVRLVELTGSGHAWQIFKRAVHASFADKEFLVRLIKSFIYPALWALTLGIYLALFLSFCRDTDALLQPVARLLPATLRGFLAPLIIAVLVIGPVSLGPLWCLWSWSLLIYIFLPWYRWVSFLAAAVLVLWAALVPIRENLDLRLAEQGVRSLLRASSGNYNFADRNYLQKLLAARPSDAAAQFVYGQVLRREGAYVEAEKAFQRAEALWNGREPLVKFERGILAFLTGDASRADSLFHEAQAAGLSSAPFLFDYSKIKFDLMDTSASRDLLGQASRMNPELIAALQAREETMGLYSRQSIAEISLPLKAFIPALLAAIPDAQRLHDAVGLVLMAGCTPLRILALGIVLLLGFFVVGSKERQTRRSMFYPHYKLPSFVRWLGAVIPGGAFVISRHPVRGGLSFAVLALLGMPIIHWPAETGVVFEYLSGLAPYYISAWSLLFLGFLYVGYFALANDSNE